MQIVGGLGKRPCEQQYFVKRINRPIKLKFAQSIEKNNEVQEEYLSKNLVLFPTPVKDGHDHLEILIGIQYCFYIVDNNNQRWYLT